MKAYLKNGLKSGEYFSMLNFDPLKRNLLRRQHIYVRRQPETEVFHRHCFLEVWQLSFTAMKFRYYSIAREE